MATTPKPADARREAETGMSDWPHVIRSKVFYGREDDHWFALDATFDVAAMGDSEDEALEALLGMVCSYLSGCVSDGLSYAEAQRPIPFRKRARLHAQASLSRPLRALRHSAGSRESEMLLPRIASA